MTAYLKEIIQCGRRNAKLREQNILSKDGSKVIYLIIDKKNNIKTGKQKK